MIKIDFEKTHDVYGIYRDALNLPEDHKHTEQEIEDMKQQRFDNWVNHIIQMSNVPLEELPKV